MQTKEYSMTLDMKRTLPFRPFEVVEGDTGNVLHISLENDGEAMDLSGCGLCVVFASSAGFAIQDLTNGVSCGAGTGEIDVQLNPNAYGAGNVSVDVQVYSGEDNATLITSTRFDFRCRRSLFSEDILRASTSYPPLIAATAEAREATEAALAAVEAIAGSLGEQNVQADWNETDAESDAYILHKPATMTPAAHTHGKADVTDFPAAMTPSPHAASHAQSSTDAVSPASIGAEQQRLQFEGTTVAAAAFVANATYADFGFRAAVPLSGVLATMTPEVVLGVPEATSGNFAPVAACYNGGVYIYAAEAPAAAITIPTIICWKAVS